MEVLLFIFYQSVFGRIYQCLTVFGFGGETETETESQPPKPKPIPKIFATETENRNRNRKSATETETDSKNICHRNRKPTNRNRFSLDTEFFSS